MRVITILSGFYFFSIAVHDELREIDCIAFTIFFFYKISKNQKTEILTFYAITFEPIKIQKCSVPQIDRLNLSFVKDIYVKVKKWLERLVKWWFMSSKFCDSPSSTRNELSHAHFIVYMEVFLVYLLSRPLFIIIIFRPYFILSL